MRLHIGVLRAEELLRAVDGELLDDINIFAAAVPALLRIAFGVLVREHRALRLHDGGAGEVFARDQLDVFLLALAFEFNGLGDFGINGGEFEVHQRFIGFKFIHTTLMASALEAGIQEGIDNLLRLIGLRAVASEAKDIRVVVAARHLGGIFIPHQRGAGARHLVGGDAHADAGGADQKAQLVLALGHAARHGLGVVGVISGIQRVRAEVRDLQAVLGQVLLQQLLQLVATMIRADGDGLGRCGATGGGGGRGRLLDEFHHRGDALLDLIAAIAIHVERAANGIGNVILEAVQRVIELAQKEGLFRRLWIQEHHRIDMAVRHAEDVIGLHHRVPAEHPAALMADVDANLPESAHGIFAGRQAIDRAHAGGYDLAIGPPLGGMAKQPLGHGAAANVASADKQNGLHSCA